MIEFPLRFRGSGDALIFTDDAGGWFLGVEDFLDRYVHEKLTDADLLFLRTQGHDMGEPGSLARTAFAWRWAKRVSASGPIGYVILVPTLRCNLSCGYCQVSRASPAARGFDWDEPLAEHVLGFLDGLTVDSVKIEFQGGEPLLRLDLLERVRSFCRKRFTESSFVVCTNLQEIGSAEWRFLADSDTHISTSLDGSRDVHRAQRTKTDRATETFHGNLAEAVGRFGAGKVSALPTIDVDRPPDFDELTDAYARFGMHSVYFRPVNHHGFARKRFSGTGNVEGWNCLHGQFIEFLIDRNWRTGTFMEEYYFSLCLRRVLGNRKDNHVDLRNPALAGVDYVVVDYDGQLYPSDEARMLSRIGHVDLSLGRVASGIDKGKAKDLTAAGVNSFDPDCIHCAYQPYCGADPIDDLSRYGRVDVPRHTTWFCQRHTAVFDKVFELIYRDDAATRASLATWAGLASWPSELSPVHV